MIEQGQIKNRVAGVTLKDSGRPILSLCEITQASVAFHATPTLPNHSFR